MSNKKFSVKEIITESRKVNQRSFTDKQVLSLMKKSFIAGYEGHPDDMKEDIDTLLSECKTEPESNVLDGAFERLAKVEDILKTGNLGDMPPPICGNCSRSNKALKFSHYDKQWSCSCGKHYKPNQRHFMSRYYNQLFGTQMSPTIWEMWPTIKKELQERTK